MLSEGEGKIVQGTRNLKWLCVYVRFLNGAPRHISANSQPSLPEATLPVQEKVFGASVVVYIMGAWHIREPHSDRTAEVGRDL